MSTGYSTYSDGKHSWLVQTLWEAAEGIEPVTFLIDDLEGPDEVVWERSLTPNELIPHMRRVLDADMNYPIIIRRVFDLGAGDRLIVVDGMHRIVRARLDGQITIRGQVLDHMPDPSWSNDTEDYERRKKVQDAKKIEPLAEAKARWAVNFAKRSEAFEKLMTPIDPDKDLPTPICEGDLMTLDEAINQAVFESRRDTITGAEQRQLASWLTELRDLKAKNAENLRLVDEICKEANRLPDDPEDRLSVVERELAEIKALKKQDYETWCKILTDAYDPNAVQTDPLETARDRLIKLGVSEYEVESHMADVLNKCNLGNWTCRITTPYGGVLIEWDESGRIFAGQDGGPFVDLPFPATSPTVK